jgi:hypothetical protein
MFLSHPEGGRGVFGEQLTAMLEAGSSLIVGVVDPRGEPRATRAWAATVTDADQRRVRIVLSGDDPVAVESLPDGVVAVTGADVRTLRSHQMKGRVDLVEPPTDRDLAMMAEHSTAFMEAVHAVDGNPISELQRLLPNTLVVFEMVVDELYDQSPGPDAGAAVVRTRP